MAQCLNLKWTDGSPPMAARPRDVWNANESLRSGAPAVARRLGVLEGAKYEERNVLKKPHLGSPLSKRDC